MRLLLLDQFSDLGGAQQGLLDVVAEIHRRGWRCVAGLPGDGVLCERLRALEVPTERIECGPYHSGRKTFRDLGRFVSGTPRLARQMRALAEALGAETVYLNGPRLLPAAVLANFRVPVVFHSHSIVSTPMSHRLTAAALSRLRATVLGCCDFAVRPWSGHVIYNGVAGPPPGWRKTPSAAPRIACIGRIAPEKGQLEFLHAARAIHATLPDARFTVYGAALFADAGALRYERDVHREAEGLPVAFPGWIADVYDALAEVDLLLVPSAAHEATTRVILEAFAAGVPVIAFNSGGIPEVIEDAVTGYLVDNAQDMAKRTIDLLQAHPADLQRVAANARQSWQQRFTVDRYAKEVVDFLAQTAAKPVAPQLTTEDTKKKTRVHRESLS